jgi:hypothetical protein
MNHILSIVNSNLYILIEFSHCYLFLEAVLAIFIVEKILTNHSILDIGDHCSDRLGISIVKVKLFDSEGDADFNRIKEFSYNLADQRYSAGSTNNLHSLKLILSYTSYIESLLQVGWYLLKDRIFLKDLSFYNHIQIDSIDQSFDVDVSFFVSR